MTKNTSVALKPYNSEQLGTLKQIGEAFGREAFEVALRQSGVKAKSDMQNVINQGNLLKTTFFNAVVDTLAEQMRIAAGLTPPDPRFELLVDLGVIEVPAVYKHETHLAGFKDRHGKSFYYYNDGITDANFAEATTKLVAGQKLHVRAFRIKKTVNSDDCLKFIASKNGILTGAQGAALVYEQKRSDLPKGLYYVSFDKKDALWKDADGYRRVPVVGAFSDGGFEFGLGGFGHDWFGVGVLLVFGEESSAA